ncbi:MAG TPA: hypothetical protein VHX62_03730 [Solirubrobacteraceae bacterium]|nr:hypothetical protein [Solirubrobacteraceae bacterium]
MHRQLANELPPRDGRRGLVLSASKELEPGARAMLLLADGLFRLDVLVSGDSLQTFVRNLSPGPLAIEGDAATSDGTSTTFGDVTPFAPGRADLGFTLGAGADRVRAQVTLATLRFPERGLMRISAQAVVRQA